MSSQVLDSNEDTTQAAKNLKRALLRTLNTDTLPATPEDAATGAARRSPFWFRCMYMLAILPELPGWGEDWTTRRIASTLAATLEEEAISSMRYRNLPRILKDWRWSVVQNRLELARFFERVEPEILVLVAGVYADGDKPLTLPAEAADRLRARKPQPSRNALVEELRSGVDGNRKKKSDLDLSELLIGYTVRNLKMTPRGNYNLACYCSNGAGREHAKAERSRWVEAAGDYLFDSLSGLDAGMDAWARVDLDLKELRSALGADFETIISRADAVRDARFSLYVSPEQSPPSPTTHVSRRKDPS